MKILIEDEPTEVCIWGHLWKVLGFYPSPQRN